MKNSQTKKIACFFGMHDYVEQEPKMAGHLVVMVKVCTECGTKKGWVEKL